MPEDVFFTKVILDPNGIEIKEENANQSAREAYILREEAPSFTQDPFLIQTLNRVDPRGWISAYWNLLSKRLYSVGLLSASGGRSRDPS
jgi:hypothetical protein